MITKEEADAMGKLRAVRLAVIQKLIDRGAGEALALDCLDRITHALEAIAGKIPG